MRLLLLFSLFFCQKTAAQICNPLVYDGFAYSANSPLDGSQGGTGWQFPWLVQNENASVPGFQTAGGGSLGWLDLQTTGNYASGGFAFLTAGRRLDTEADGPFAAWLTDNGAIGQPGATLWASILLRKTQNNAEEVAAYWHDNNLQWCAGCTANKVAVGYFGSNSDVGGQRRWTLRIGNDYYPTPAPMTPNETVFFVLKFDFSAGSTAVSLYVNPTSLGNDIPAPTPTITQTTATPLEIRSLALYLGDDAASGHADEIRMGATYACTAPDPSVSVNQAPNAAFIMTPPTGMAPLAVMLDASASADPDGSIVAYDWDFGDGSADAAGQTVSHTFSATGILKTTLTVTDNLGLQHSFSQNIPILNANGTFSCLLGLVNENLASCTGNDGRFRITNYNNIPLQLTNSAGATIPPAAGDPNLYDNLTPGIYQLTAAGANGCRDTFAVHIQRDSATCPGWAPDPCAMKIGVGIEGLAYYSQCNPFKDYFKSCGAWITYDPDPPGGNFIWNTGNQQYIPADLDGYATQVPFAVPNGSGQNALRGIISALGFIPAGVPMRLLYDGVGTLQMQGNVTVTVNQPGQIDFTANDADNIFFNLTFSQAGNPVRNIRVVELADIDTYQAQPFQQGFLDKCSEFNTLRFMDWARTNGSEQAQWTNRTQPAYYSQAESPRGGLAYEYIIQLANQLNINIWLCIPHQADDDYIAEMAAMFRDQLDPGITVYIEYSNEVWNWIFPQAHWVNDNGPQNISYPRRYVERATHAFDIWMSVWGPESTRLRRVLGTQVGYDWITEEILAHAAPGKYDYISPSWYFGLDHSSTGNPNLQALGASATPEDVLANATNVFLNFYPYWQMVYRTAKLYDKKVANYEGGQHFTDFTVPPYIQAMYDAQVHPGMYTLYNRVLDSLRRQGSELPLAFVLCGPWESQYGSWGHIFDLDDPAPWDDRPKFQVLIDQIARCVETPSGSEPIENQSGGAVRIVPNPTAGTFRLEIPADWPGRDFAFIVRDALGRPVLTRSLSDGPITLGQDLPNGIYQIEILDVSGKRMAVRRVVKVGH